MAQFLFVAAAAAASASLWAVDWNPLGFPSYRQEIVVRFGDAEAASGAEMSVADLPEGATRAFATRWDDTTTQHVAKAAMLKRAGVKGNFYLIGGEAERVPGWVTNLVAHGHAIGNHTLGHPRMNGLSQTEAYRQILLERIRLETELGVTINSYVSPYGWWGRWASPDAKRNVLRSAIYTGHWVSCDNPLGDLGVSGAEWMAANRFEAGDKHPSRGEFESGLRRQIAAADRDPLFPRIVLGTHSWCDEAGNAIQEALLKEHCVRPEWVQLNDWEYGAYRYSALNARIEKPRVEGSTAHFTLTRFEPVSLAHAIPLSVRFSCGAVSATCGGRTLGRGANGTWTVPHDPNRATRLAAVVRDEWKGVRVVLVPDGKTGRVTVRISNGSADSIRNVAIAVMTPPPCELRRLTVEIPLVKAGSSAERHLMLSKEDGRDGLASRSAVFAANADFDLANGRARIWVTATAGGIR